MENFDISGKVALVTGGISGIGLTYAQLLLENGAKGVTLADINENASHKVVKELEEKYGKNKVIFVKTDVADYTQFEHAFKQTVATFKNVDILINNAGFPSETKDLWRKTVEVNTIGVLNGILLGLENYLFKYKSGQEGLIVNTSSIAGIRSCPAIPIYATSKFGVIGATISFGHPLHYSRQHVKVVAICPGGTDTPMIRHTQNAYHQEAFNKMLASAKLQTLEEIAPELLKVIKKAPNGTVWILENGEPAYQYILPDPLQSPKVYL